MLTILTSLTDVPPQSHTFVGGRFVADLVDASVDAVVVPIARKDYESSNPYTCPAADFYDAALGSADVDL